MNNNLLFAKQVLEQKKLTLVLYNGKNTIESEERGVKPLLKLLDSKENFSLYSAADKVIGKAAAFLYVNLGITDVYTQLISEEAANIFTINNIHFETEQIVPYIINRKKDGKCPMESAVWNITEPIEAEKIIREKIQNMK